MGLFDGLEKLINEHGSSQILHERLELAADKYSKLESELAELKVENAALRQERATLQAEVVELKQAHAVLQDGGAALEPDEDRILGIMFEKASSMSLDQVCRTCGIQVAVCQYHFDRLLRAEMIRQTRASIRVTAAPPSPALFGLTPKGREHVVRRMRLEKSQQA